MTVVRRAKITPEEKGTSAMAEVIEFLERGYFDDQSIKISLNSFVLIANSVAMSVAINLAGLIPPKTKLVVIIPLAH